MATESSTVSRKYNFFLSLLSNFFYINSYILIASFNYLRCVSLDVTLDAAETVTIILSEGQFLSCYIIFYIERVPKFV